MKIKIWTHKAQKLVFDGEMDFIPRKGEQIEFTNQEIGCFTVDEVFHFPDKNTVEIELCFDGQENLINLQN